VCVKTRGRAKGKKKKREQDQENETKQQHQHMMKLPASAFAPFSSPFYFFWYYFSIVKNKKKNEVTSRMCNARVCRNKILLLLPGQESSSRPMSESQKKSKTKRSERRGDVMCKTDWE
jgi:hypothetical protein